MITLAFDSAAKVASVAVLKEEAVLGCYSIDNGRTQSELLLPMAEDLLKSLKLGFADVDLLACTTGPGSFTGVRIGAAVIKGLAFGRNTPCVGVSTLESLAYNLLGLKGLIIPVMDARRGQFYTAAFRCDGDSIERLTEDSALSCDELASVILSSGESCVYLVGDGYKIAKEALSSHGVVTESTPPSLIPENAASAGLIAYRKYLDGEYTSDVNIKPTYLRLPQAERERLERLSKNK